MANEYYSHNSAHERSCVLARSGLKAVRDSQRTHCPRAARKSAKEREISVIYEARWFRAGSAGSLGTQGLLAFVKGIADTGFLVAFANGNDRHHRWATQIAGGLSEPLLTCEAVLAETAFHLESAAVALAMINEGLIALAFDCREHLIQLERLAARYADRKPDLADLCLVRMSELFPKHSVITIDRTDFQVFRRNKREAIPILCPPER